eukprot:TRINITY_DN99270_c0_g1_i1.p1 TRINITY_DN99270_c0_g1~~TRINITY_DN99270_c0_g1_i1.p1  ORF type:complete len:128 (-),score=24.88 TRINITY_DN99270_c0_g1_i1:4-387(-)
MISQQLLDAIRMVETGGVLEPENAVGDDGQSLGPFQIKKEYYQDAIEFEESLVEEGDYQNVRDVVYAEKVVIAYMKRYATFERLGREPSFEDIARIHNGGPNGYNNPHTQPYWEKVLAVLNSLEDKK